MSVVTDVRFGADPDRQSEQALREDLAAAFRLAVKFGWSESSQQELKRCYINFHRMGYFK